MATTKMSRAGSMPRDPTNPEIGIFLASRTGHQMVQLMQAMRDPAAQATLTTALLIGPPLVAARAAPVEKPKKALNAFVGFRCYYIAIPTFKQYPMKKLSNPMSALWEADPNKPLWLLLAKAWSTIRDQTGKDQAPLDEFFSLVCPRFRIPSPENYLDLMGWYISTDEDGTPTVSRNPLSMSLPYDAGAAAASLSVEDIIEYAQSHGYAHDYVHHANLTSSTFLGHSAGQAVAMTESATDVQDRRLAARNKRRAQRQEARETGFSAEMQKQIMNAHALDNTPTITSAHPQHHLYGLPRYNAAVDFNTPFHNHLPAAMSNNTLGRNDNGEGHSRNAASDSTDWSAFRSGADADVSLPNVNHWQE
ncbi:hypothetical protein CC80DRAFT_18133 [Byssothecium circinans]|uniref:Mating-type protein MAT-1 n=1 Tax=Byssothecium circinans TaxID=147558 RepID=A0A6A5UC99_9PLEO|nr:hypothetical protein CC80DRAFT_18133 [Byssothecium circinans]